jgi:O-antigen ligase
VNWRIPKPLFTARNLAWLAGFMLVFWAPFRGEHRLPIFILLVVGIFLHVASRRLLPAGLAERRWGAIFLLLWIPCLLATPFSYNLRGSLTVCLVLLLHYWVGIALLHGMRQPGHAYAAKWIGWTLLFWTVDGGIQFIFGRDLFGVPLPNDMRIVGPFDGNLHMGLFIVVLMPLLLWPLAKTRPWTALFLFVPMSAISTLAGARTNMVFALLLALALTFRLPTWKHRVMLLLLSLSPALVIPFSPVLQERVMQRSYAILGSEAGQNKQSLFERLDAISSGRLIIWETAGNMLRAHPLTGVGPAAFDTAYPNFATRANDLFRNPNAEGKYAYHAHQMYVSAGAETGLIGLAGLLFGIALIVRWYRQAAPLAREAANPYLVSLAVIAFPINSQPVLTAGWWFPIVLLLLGGMLAALETVYAPAAE